MKVIRAKSAGFCFGVERAIEIATTCTDGGKCKVFTDGPLIHNRQMMERLTNCGVLEIGDYKSESSISDQISKASPENSVLVFRAHGVSPDRRKYLQSLGLRCKDATCPDVGKIAGIIKMHANKNYTTVIVGDPDHPEVIGLLGYAGGKGYVVKDTKAIDKLPDIQGDICMVSQSTMFTDDYNQISDISGLEDCPLLTQLDLWDNPVDEAQVKALQDIGRIVNYNPQYKPEATAS